MIVSDTHRFFFVHIPKNAGTTIRQQLTAFDPNCQDVRGREMHPELGRLFKTHLTLAQMRDHFPDLYEKALAYECFAVMREPHGRFLSALRQYLLEFRQLHLPNMGAPEQRSAVLEVLDALGKQDPTQPDKFVHFNRQVDYITLDGTQVVDHLYRMEEVPALLSTLSRRVGVSMNTAAQANQSLAFRAGWMSKPAYRMNRFLKNTIPHDFHQRLKSVAKPLVAHSPKSATPLDTLAELPEIDRFVVERYAPDIALYDTFDQTLEKAVD